MSVRTESAATTCGTVSVSAEAATDARRNAKARSRSLFCVLSNLNASTAEILAGVNSAASATFPSIECQSQLASSAARRSVGTVNTTTAKTSLSIAVENAASRHSPMAKGRQDSKELYCQRSIKNWSAGSMTGRLKEKRQSEPSRLSREILPSVEHAKKRFFQFVQLTVTGSGNIATLNAGQQSAHA